MPPVQQREKKPTRMIAEVIKAHEAGSKKPSKAKGGKKGKKGRQKSLCAEQTSSILKELKNALRPVTAERRGEDGSRPSTPIRSAHDQLMESIRGSSIRNLRRVSGGANKTNKMIPVVCDQRLRHHSSLMLWCCA